MASITPSLVFRAASLPRSRVSLPRSNVPLIASPISVPCLIRYLCPSAIEPRIAERVSAPDFGAQRSATASPIPNPLRKFTNRDSHMSLPRFALQENGTRPAPARVPCRHGATASTRPTCGSAAPAFPLSRNRRRPRRTKRCPPLRSPSSDPWLSLTIRSCHSAPTSKLRRP